MSHDCSGASCPICGDPSFRARNNPGYKSEYKELERAQETARHFHRDISGSMHNRFSEASVDTPAVIGWLAAEVRVMRLERALER